MAAVKLSNVRRLDSLIDKAAITRREGVVGVTDFAIRSEGSPGFIPKVFTSNPVNGESRSKLAVKPDERPPSGGLSFLVRSQNGAR